MKNNLNLLSVLLFVLLLSLLFTACNTSINTSEKTETNAPAVTSAPVLGQADNDMLEPNTQVTNTQVSNAPATAAPVTNAALTTSAPVIDLPTEDFAGQLEFDEGSSSLKQKVTVKTYVDGDTTHFYVPTTISASGVLKARYLGINTPESTGKIEEFGKAASRFTKEKLSGASSIYVESDDGAWNLDSTGDRHLVWVWYRTNENEKYRNLNIELLQNGLAIASNSANNRYGSVCMASIAQAERLKLNVYSGEKDPDMYYGAAIELTLKELRCNVAEYNGKKVAFSGVITRNYNNGVYVESYDADTDMYYGMYVYYGFNLSGAGLAVLDIGNEVRIVGTLSLYETAGTYQVSGLTYDRWEPTNPNNIQKLGDGKSPVYMKVDADKFKNGKVKIETETESEVFVTEYGFANLAMNTSISMNGLKVKYIYTTKNEESSSKGAMTLTCEVNGVTVTLRTTVLYDEGGNLVTEDAYLYKTINVKGIVDYYDGSYQIKIFSPKDITIVN